MNDVTRILHRIEQGDPSAADQLLPLIYQELRRLAAARMANESPDHTLQATALVHEAYVRLVDVEVAQEWDSRAHFFAAAAEAMRRILVEISRRKQSSKHGGEVQRTEADLDHLAMPEANQRILAIDEALIRLAEEQPVAAKLVELRYFAGLTLKEAAAALDVPPRTADRHWSYAKAWLHREIQRRD